MTRSWRHVSRVAIGVVAVAIAWLIIGTAFATRMMAADHPGDAHRIWSATPHAATRLAEAALHAGDPRAAAYLAEALALRLEDPRALHVASTLAFAAGDRAVADRIMLLAAQTGWRDAAVQRWVLERALFDRDWPTAARAADALLRTNGDRAAGTAGFIRLLATDGGRAALADRIALAPDWAPGFLRADPTTPADRAGFADLLRRLAARNALPAGYDPAAGATAMLADGRVDPLVTQWRAVDPAAGDPRTAIVDGGFDRLAAGPPVSAPFGWQVPPRSQATLSFTPQAPDGADPALTIEAFGADARPALTQLLALRPGRYTLSFTGRIVRGEPSDFAIELRCTGRGAAVPLRPRAAVDPNASRQQAMFAIPPACPSQTLAILAGSASSDGAQATFDAFRVAPAR
ncbi:hypothetical protein ACFSGX_02275 [Sphingomonas arantia]|uniref:Tetratricopeptide repeat protein n=1 Tax=Sphingomonas arantia TaxID=1460676 RepID=A0ABW4TSE2_9SPHN